MFPFRRQVRVQPWRLHLFGQVGRVLAVFGHRDVAVDYLEACLLQPGLEAAQMPQVRPESHETDIGLVAKHGHRQHLMVAVRRFLHRVDDRLAI